MVLIWVACVVLYVPVGYLLILVSGFFGMVVWGLTLPAALFVVTWMWLSRRQR